MMRLLFQLPVILSLATMLLGCGLREEMEASKQTRQRIKSKLNDLQNRAGIDFETQQMIEAVFHAYSGYTSHHNRPPMSWSELAATPNLTSDHKSHIRNAQNTIQKIVWGIDLRLVGTDGTASETLLSLDNPLMGNVIVLQNDGQIRMVSDDEL